MKNSDATSNKAKATKPSIFIPFGISPLLYHHNHTSSKSHPGDFCI